VSYSVGARPPTRKQQSEVTAVDFVVVVEVIETRAIARPPVGQQKADVRAADSRVVIEVAGTACGE
jgi:hypothetical protein